MPHERKNAGGDYLRLLSFLPKDHFEAGDGQ
jgi:hypothetical protein